MGDVNFLFTGNTANGQVVTISFPWPVYTSAVRIYPQTWVSTIEMSFALYGYVKGLYARCMLFPQYRLNQVCNGQMNRISYSLYFLRL